MSAKQRSLSTPSLLWHFLNVFTSVLTSCISTSALNAFQPVKAVSLLLESVHSSTIPHVLFNCTNRHILWILEQELMASLCIIKLDPWQGWHIFETQLPSLKVNMQIPALTLHDLLPRHKEIYKSQQTVQVLHMKPVGLLMTRTKVPSNSTVFVWSAVELSVE